MKIKRNKNRQRLLRRFSINHILQSKITSTLLIVLAGIFTFILLWMNYLTIKNKVLIDKTYKENIITADIKVADDGSSWVEGGPINGRHIDNLSDTGLVENYTAIAEMYYKELYINRDGVVKKYEAGEKDTVHFFTRKPTFNVYASNKGYNDKGLLLTKLNFLEGYSLQDFNREYTGDYSDRSNPIVVNEKGEEGFPVLVSNKAMEHFDLEFGDRLFLEPNLKSRDLLLESYGTVVGTFKEIDKSKDTYDYSIKTELDLFIYPLSALEAMEREIYYKEIEFEFKSEKNKELMERKDELRKIVFNNPFNEYPTELKIWDGEIINVVEPLEKNISLLEILYPLTFALSIIIAGILVFLLSLNRSIDVAILRMLGVKEKEVRWSLFRENLILVIIGIVLSSIIIISITSASYPIELATYLKVIGGYLLGTVVGLVLGIGRVTNKKPLEMLQVKE